MRCFTYHTMTRTMFILFILLQPVFGARNLDDNPTDEYLDPGEADELRYVRWSVGDDLRGTPRWPGAALPITLKYAFGQNKPIAYLSQPDIGNAFARAFGTWSSVIQVSFEETDSSSKPNIRIGFFHGLPNGVLNHASLPPKGILRLNADVEWAVGEVSEDAFDLESVAIHAIGHLLGLEHSKSKDSIMYSHMAPGIKKVDLAVEDVVRAQQLYRPNPEYHHQSFGPNPEYHHESYGPNPAYHHESYGTNPAYHGLPSPLPSGSGVVKELSTRSLGFNILVAGLIILASL